MEILLLLCLIVGLVLTGFFHAELMAAVWAFWYLLIHLTVITWVHTHPWLAVGYGAGYFLIGALWSVGKWWFEETDHVRKAKAQWHASRHPQGTWEDYRVSHKTRLDSYEPDIMFWISLWPLSATYTLLNDPFRRLCRRIYNELRGVYQRITDYVWQ